MVGDKPNAPLEQYIVETVDDLAEIISDAEGPKDITRTLPFGSIAFVIDNKSFYMVGFDSNNNKTWIDISESSSGKPEQSKTVTPTKSGVTVRPDIGHALSSVEVEPIPEQFPDVSDTTATPATVLSGEDFYGADGTKQTGACTFDADTSDADATAGQIEAGATAYVGGAKVTGTMPVRTTDVEISDLSPVPIPEGSYDGMTSAKLSSAAAAEVVASNIRQGAEILGVQGSYAGADTLDDLIANTLTSYSNPTATSLKDSLFMDNYNLASVSLPALETIGSKTFCYCKGFTGAFGFPNVQTVGEYAFQHCEFITSADFPELVTLGQGAFSECYRVASVNIPKVNEISADAFFFCESLVSVYAPLAIGVRAASFNNHGAFAGCTSLVSAVLPSCSHLYATNYSGAFNGCTSLAVLDIGVACTIDGGVTFRNCRALTTIILRGTSVSTLSNVSAFNSTPFASGGTGGTIYIPESLYNHLGDGTALDYKAATNWSVLDAYGTITWAKIEGSQYEVTT